MLRRAYLGVLLLSSSGLVILNYSGYSSVLKNTPFVPVRYAVDFGTWIDCPNSLPRRGYYRPRS